MIFRAVQFTNGLCRPFYGGNMLELKNMRCKGRVFRDTGQGAKIIVVLVGLVAIFKKQLVSLVNNILAKITKQSNSI